MIPPGRARRKSVPATIFNPLCRFRNSAHGFSHAVATAISPLLADAFEEGKVDFGIADEDVFTPAITLWAMISQRRFKQVGRSCKAAANRFIIDAIATAARWTWPSGRKHDIRSHCCRSWQHFAIGHPPTTAIYYYRPSFQMPNSFHRKS